jgi:flagellar biosynthesis protein FlhG
MKSQLSHFLELRNYGIKIPKSCPFITFTSGKGGVGKSSLCVNLATTLGLTHKVLLVDGDPGMADLHILLGKTPDLNWSDFIKGDKSIDEVISKGIHGIDLLHGFSGVTDLDLTSGESIRKILLGLGEVSKNYDVVLIDSGAK